jgi:hypothetical protein
MAKKKPKKLKKRKKIGKLQNKLRILEERLNVMEKREQEFNAVYEEIQHLSRGIDRLKSLLPDVIWDKNFLMRRSNLTIERDD